MGTKGNELTQDSVQMAELLKEKLGSIEGVSTKKMFGGHGIFHKGKMFGIVDSKGQAYFKANDYNKADFANRGAHQHGKMPYFSISYEVLSDHGELLALVDKTLKTIH